MARRPSGSVQPVRMWPVFDDAADSMMKLDNSVLDAMEMTSGMSSPSRTKRMRQTNPYASFLQMRPPRKQSMSATEDSIGQEIRRTKRQLLEVAIISELRSLDPTKDDERTGERLDRLRKARKHLSEVTGLTQEEQELLESPRTRGFEHHRATLSASTSTPALLAAVTAFQQCGEAVQKRRQEEEERLRRIKLPAIGGADRLKTVPLLKAWFYQTRTWNTGWPVDPKTHLFRKDSEQPGGCIAVGNGRMPLYSGDHLLSPGYFFAFRVDAIDNKHFPVTEGSRERVPAIAFGVTRLPGHDPGCLRPNFAYDIPQSILFGYSGTLIDHGKWRTPTCFWDPKTLQPGDEVGVLIPTSSGKEGDLAIFVNGVQKLRVATSLNDGLSDEGEKVHGRRLQLYPVIDLTGRVCAVTLLTRAQPPQVVLECRNRFK